MPPKAVPPKVAVKPAVLAGASIFGTNIETLQGLVDKDEGHATLSRLGGRTGLSRALKTDFVSGRTDSSAIEAARREYFGKNELPAAHQVTFMELFIESLSDKMMLLLVASAIISLVLGLTMPPEAPEAHQAATGAENVDVAVSAIAASKAPKATAKPEGGESHHAWIEGTAILISVFIVTMVSSLNNYQKEMKFKELNAARPATMVMITRGGAKKEIKDTELLVGDILHLVGGQIVPVDGVVLKCTDFKLDESASTGENDEVEKTLDGDCFLRSGTNVLEGEGTVVVTALGEHSFAGRITMQCREEKQDTPLQVKLEELADTIGKFGMWAAVLMFVVLLIKEIHTKNYNFMNLKAKPVLNMLTTAVTIVVVAVPEGLPLSVTIALAYSMKQMMRENNLVRHLAACETMGGATTICTDKTGTLTQNEMTVMRGVLGHTHFEFTGEKLKDADTLKSIVPGGRPSPLLELLAESIAVNSSAIKKSVPIPGGTVMRYQGNKTEQALLQYLERIDFDPMKIRGSFDAASMHSYPFTSAKKRMTTVLRLPDTLRFHVKGASESILDDCAKFHNGTRIEPMNHEHREALMNTIYDMACNRLRTIGVAYTDMAGWEKRPFDAKEPSIPSFTLLGIIGIEDPIRPEVEPAVRRCMTAGVSVKMVTGDNKATAISIAKKAGIYGTVYSGPQKGEMGLAMEGKYFRELAKSPRYMNNILPKLQVLARASPLDKQILVAALMERGEVVAVTGDGTNDAPALKNANVGFAMNSGTEVAKNASDVIILDDNFRSIVTAMKWGRNVNDNICKFIQFQTTVNVAAVCIAFVGAVISTKGESPLKPVQLLWLNLIMDTMAALALATEPPSDSVLLRPPRKKDDDLITRRMWVNILGQASYQIFVQLWLLNYGYEWFGVPHQSIEHLTVLFNVFVLMQVANEFNARILDNRRNILAGLLKAHMFLLIIIITLVVQCIGVTFAGEFMQATPIEWELWKKCFLISIIPVPLGIFLRLLPVKERVIEEGEYYQDVEDEVWNAKMANRPQMTFRRAALTVISLLKTTGAMQARLRMKRS